jgi:SAM-dependent methyltransferase
MSWRDFWNQDTPIYVSERHKALHYQLIAKDVSALIPTLQAVVLDYGCGEALSADRVADTCSHLYLCDGAPLVRERLTRRFRGDPRIHVLAPEEMETVADGTLDVIVVNSLLQYLSLDEFRALLGLWRRKLQPEGRLILADVIPPDVSPVEDARSLLAFGWRGGFFKAAALGLVRTALSDYRKIRNELGLSQYGSREMVDLLRDAGYEAERRPRNLGHNQARMSFIARPAEG